MDSTNLQVDTTRATRPGTRSHKLRLGPFSPCLVLLLAGISTSAFVAAGCHTNESDDAAVTTAPTTNTPSSPTATPTPSSAGDDDCLSNPTPPPGDDDTTRTPENTPGASTATPTPPPSTPPPSGTPSPSPSDTPGQGTPAPSPTPTPAGTPTQDADGDGFPAASDCDDADPAVYPGAEEQCDTKDNDCDGLTDEDAGCPAPCPEDMVAFSDRVCIDRYEASRPDATENSAGTDESRATSRPGVLPWMVNPMSSEQLETFASACKAAGKRLCTADEWHDACTGPDPGTYYVYGDSFDREACNCVDSFCDDYCADHGIQDAECSLSPNCGYEYNCFHVVPTGQFESCTNAFGTFDMNGNVWEAVSSTSDARGYELRGGAFNCASASSRVNCAYNATWESLYAGFRCCLDRTRG